MREINFRAWGNEFDRAVPNYQMYQVTGIDMTITGDEIYRIGVRRPFGKEPTYLADDYKLMQYTGLKDKNGVEIYEGDIVKGADVDKDNRTGVIGFQDGTFEVLDKEGVQSYYYPEMRFTDDWEVIGNIHQNPELLK